MPTRYKKEGIVTIPAGLFGENEVLIDSPEFEILQGRQANYTAYIGVKYYYKQGEVDLEAFVEYPVPFANLNEVEMQAITDLITSANINILSTPSHAGSVVVST